MKAVSNMRRIIISLGLVGLMVLIWPAWAAAATDPGLASAAPFAVLAGTTVTNTGATVVNGQLGVFPGAAVTGFGGAPNGTINGAQHNGDSVAGVAQTDLTAAYVNAAAQPCPATNNLSNQNLGGKTLVPGVYCQTTAPTLTGTLTLNGSGIYIFQIGSTLVTAPSATISLIGGAQPCQIFWQVSSSATLDTTTTFVGTIMALTSIGLNNGVLLTGRALARNGAVTLINDTINLPAACVVAPPSPTPTATPTATPAPGATPSPGGGVGVVPGATGVPPELTGGAPWLLLLGIGAGLGATALGLSSRRRRRRRV
jgi:hypothetical protein